MKQHTVNMIDKYMQHMIERMYAYKKRAFLLCYNHIYLPFRIRQIRRKSKIKVLFLVSEISKWKTENLYRAMLLHDRFEPIIAILTPICKNTSLDDLKVYMEDKGYSFNVLNITDDIQSLFSPDIIFYIEGWRGYIDSRFEYRNNRKSLICYVMYSFHNSFLKSTLDLSLYNDCWQLYYENDLATSGVGNFMRNRGKNIIVTGLPLMDRDIEEIKRTNPWKDEKRKHIIYAPHFSITNGRFGNATFLSTGLMMLEIAKQYKDKVYWTFKPHPSLKIALYKVWGKEKTDAYYSEWTDSDFSQIELGKYESLFYYSDAMIHDSMSFIVEYQYSLKPALYLKANTDVIPAINAFTKKAYDLHYLSNSRVDIENFVTMIIDGGDNKEGERREFVRSFLTPPHGKPACENIINAILGREEYKDC